MTLISPRAEQIQSDLISADQLALAALSEYQSMQYADPAVTAKTSYDSIVDAASRINVPIEPQAPQADDKSHGKNSLFLDSTDSWRQFRVH